MNEREILGKLAAAANRERAPAVSVSREVIAAINVAQDEQDDRPMIWIAALASAAAFTACILAVQSFDVWLDPSLIAAFSLVRGVTL
jgi:hypothetical protein